MGKINIFILLLLACNVVFPRIPFEKHFKKYSSYYFKHERIDYRWFIAQAKQESRFDSLATSPVGAKGIMQIMPNTWNDLIKSVDKVFSISSPKYNIKYGIKYDKQMWNIFKAPRPLIDRISFMFASYNAGAGNIIKAQRIALNDNLNDNLWDSIKLTLPRVTGHHSKETITYIKRIKKYYKELSPLNTVLIDKTK